MKIRLFYFCFLFMGLVVVINPGALSPPDPLVNTMQCQGVVGFDFSGSSSNEQIALFIINSNAVNGVDVSFRFANRCKFTCGTREIPMTAVILDKVSGVLGTGLAEPIDLDVLHNLSGDEFIWDPGAAQTTETVNYIVELRASWANPAGKLAGFYSEAITAVISVGL